MEKTERKWSARITDGRTIGRKCAFVVGLHNDSVYEDCIASIELNHKEDADGWFEKYSRIADCMNTCSELQAKAVAYDRLMSGGKKTLKELANILGRAVVVDASGDVESFAGEPSIDLHYGFWYLNEDDEDYEDDRFLIPRDIVDFKGDWKNSLTLPDGWEETKDDKRA